ncbi:DIL domain containing protein [Balamuthia mandrillaris]
MGTTSGSDDELYMDEEDIFVANDDYEDEKERNIPEVSKGEEVNYRRKVELLEQECYERGKTIRSLEEQLHSAKKTLKSLQKAQGGQQWSISTKGKQDKPGPSAEIETETSKDIVQTLQRRIQILEFVECNIYQAKKLVLSKDGMPVVGEYMFIWMVNNHILDDSPNGSSVIAAGDEKSTISKVLNAIHACAKVSLSLSLSFPSSINRRMRLPFCAYSCFRFFIKRAKVHEKGYWLSVACYFLHMLHKDSLSGSLAQFLKESVMTLITSIINNLLCDVYHVRSPSFLLSFPCYCSSFQLSCTDVCDNEQDLDPVLIPAILEQPSSFLQQEEKSDEETESSTEMKVVPKLEEYFRVFKDNNVPNQLMQQFFAHLLRFIDYTLCNSLFAQKHLCTCANGFQIKLELSKVEQWISKTLGDLREDEHPLKFITQVANVLVMDKLVLTQPDALAQICPNLSLTQVNHLLELFTPDSLAPEPIPKKLFKRLHQSKNRDSSYTFDVEEQLTAVDFTFF